MKFVENYIHEVVKRLPENMREDISLELQSTIEDMLPENYTEEDVKNVLIKLGNPISLANGYTDNKNYLIGPKFFDLYWTLIKIVVPIIGAVVFLVAIISNLGSLNGLTVDLSVSIFVDAITQTVEAIFQSLIFITVAFVICERSGVYKGEQPLTLAFREWSPDDLKHMTVPSKKKEISLWDIFFSFVFIAFGVAIFFTGYKYIGVYGPDAPFIPLINQDVLLKFTVVVIIVAILEVLFIMYQLIVRQWTKKLAIFNTIMEIIGSALALIIIFTKDIFNPDFLTYSNEFINIANVTNYIFIGIIILVLITMIFNIYEGFKKANY